MSSLLDNLHFPKLDQLAGPHYIPIIALLENAIYVTYTGLHEVMVFDGQPPFNKLSTIKIEQMEEPYWMVANAARNAIYISETGSERQGIWLVNVVGEVKVTHQRLEQGGAPKHLSITPNDQLLAVVHRRIAMTYDGNVLVPDPLYRVPSKRFSLEIIDSDNFSLMKFIRLSSNKCVSSAGRLPDNNFVVCFSKVTRLNAPAQSWSTYICVISSDGLKSLWMLDTSSVFPRISNKLPVTYNFAINEVGSIFLADSYSHYLVSLDHQWTKFSLIWNNLYHSFAPRRVVYRMEDRTLLVLDRKAPGEIEQPPPRRNGFVVSVLHLKEKLGEQIVPDLDEHALLMNEEISN